MASRGRLSAKIIFLLLLASLLVPTAVRATSKQEGRLKELLPTSKDLPGWSLVKGTYVFCPTPGSLTKIYDGGYEAYTKRGTLSAVSSVYQRKSPKGTLTVTVHRTKGATYSKALYTWLKSQAGKVKMKPVSVAKRAWGCVFPIPGGHVAYGFYDRFMVSINAAGENTGRSAEVALKAVLQKALPKRK